jgi:hypothetical protein
VEWSWERGTEHRPSVLGFTLGISANTDLICQAKGILPPIPLKQTNKLNHVEEKWKKIIQFVN